MLDQAAAAGGVTLVRLLRQAVATEDRNAHGRSTRAYSDIAESVMLERTMHSNAKRARLHEHRQDAIAETDAKRLLATEEKAREESKQEAIANVAARFLANKNSEDAAAAAAKKRHNIWLQTVFPAKHAARMGAFLAAMSTEAMSHTRKTMATFFNH